MATEKATRRDWRKEKAFLGLFVFCTGAAVMSVEFTAQRLLEPFFGNSEMVWATLIGIILLALSSGYALGGRAADRWPTPDAIALLALGSGVFVALIPAISRPLLTAVSGGLLNTPSGIVISALLGTSLLFILPVAALGAVSPYAVRLLVKNKETAGSKTGSLYFWSTFGSLAGTFIATLYAIPNLGVRETMWLSSAVLIVLGSVTLAKAIFLVLCTIPLLSSQLSPPLLKPVHGLIAEVETPYQFAQVYRLPGGDIALSVNDSTGIQSLYTPHNLTGLYYDAYLTLPFMFPQSQPVKTLLIGMAAGTIPTLYNRDVDPYRANVAVTGVEIDPGLVNLGRKYFHLSPRYARVINADGRVYLRSARSKYNLMIVDAYSQEIYIPFYLTTKQFFSQCRSHLNAGGILAMNVNVTSNRSPLLLSVERTLATSFPYVYSAKAPGAYNQLILASSHPLSLPSAAAVPVFLDPVIASLQATWQAAHPGKGLVLSDNRAPVQQMTNQMILNRLGTHL